MFLGLRDRIDDVLGIERDVLVVERLLEEAAAAKRQGQLPPGCESAVQALKVYSLTLDGQETDSDGNHHEGHKFKDLRHRIDNALGVERDPALVRGLLEEAEAAKRIGQLPPGCDAAVRGLQMYAMTLGDPESRLDTSDGSSRNSDVGDEVSEVYEKLSREGEAALLSGQLVQVQEVLFLLVFYKN